MFSFIIPCYQDNRVFKSIDSFLAADQSDECEVLIVINGSSQDYVDSILTKYKQSKNVRVINISYKNISYARNIGILLSKNKYIVYMDSDCYIEPNYINILKKHNLDFDIIRGTVIFESFKPPLNQAYARLRTMWYKYPMRLYSPNLVLKKSLFSKYGYYDPQLGGCEDSEFSERIDHTKLNIKSDVDLIMHHQPDKLSRIYKTWIIYGHLRSFLIIKDFCLNNINLFNLFKSHFFKFTKYKLTQGPSFFFILLYYTFIRFIGTLHGLYLYRDALKENYFSKRTKFLKSKAFIDENTNGIIRKY